MSSKNIFKIFRKEVLKLNNKICIDILKAISKRNEMKMISSNLNLYINMYYYIKNEFKINKPNSIEICGSKIIGSSSIRKHNYYKKYIMRKTDGNLYIY